MKELMKVVKPLDVISGMSDNGNDWEKQTVVFSTAGEKPRMLAVSFMGERKTKFTKKLKPGMICEVTYTVESHEFGDKWFTNVDGISVTPFEKASMTDDAPNAAEEQAPEEPKPEIQVPEDKENEKLS